jgi:hypothetical protein
VLYKNTQVDSQSLSDPLATQVVNAAIHLFATSLPLQAPRVQESILEQLSSFLSDNNLQRDPARRAAMSVNIGTALFLALKVAVRETSLPPGDLRTEGVAKAMRELLRVSIGITIDIQLLMVRRVSCSILTNMFAILQLKHWDDYASLRGIASRLRRLTISLIRLYPIATL